MEKTKVVTIEGQQYQLGKMRADEGAYIHWRMLGALLSQKQEESTNVETAETAGETTDEEKAKALCGLAFMRGLSFDDMKFAQRAALRVVIRVETATGTAHPMPILTVDGKFLPAELEDDAALVSRLTLEALAFNLAPFFSNRQ